jgi:hypothetical protein
MNLTPTVQDRIAVAIMERTMNALGLVRKGNIEKAAYILAKKTSGRRCPQEQRQTVFRVAKTTESFGSFVK